MAHKTRVGGTNYEISGGIVQVSGTDYSISNGRALAGGTSYDISFGASSGVVNITSTRFTSTRMKYLNGYWVMCGSYSSTGYVAYTTALDGTWTVKTIGSKIELNDIAYGNGYWVVGGYDKSGDIQTANIWYTTSLSGTWTSKSIWDTYDNNKINSIAYGNGYWVVGGQNNIDAYDYWATEGRVAYATSLTGTWTTEVLVTSSTTSQLANVRFVDYINNTWIAAVESRSGATTYATDSYIFYNTSPDQTWNVSNELWGGGDSFVNSVIYANGYWVAVGEHCETASEYGSGYARIAYTSSLSGTWSIKNLWTSNYWFAEALDLAYANGYWVAVGSYAYGEGSSKFYNVYGYSTSLSGTWTKVNSDDFHSVTNHNGTWVLAGNSSGYPIIRWAKGNPANLSVSA